MFIDDIFEVFIGSTVTHQMFADDLKLFSTVRTPTRAAGICFTDDINNVNAIFSIAIDFNS